MKSQMLLALSLIMLCSSFQRAYAGLRLRKNPPCSPYWKTPKGGCDKRFRPCGTHQAWSRWSGQKFDMIIDREPGWRHCVWHRTDPYEGKRILVQFDGPKVDGHDCWEIYMQPGECWGKHSFGDYNCMGRCGPGCGSWLCSNWGPLCLQHDVCSYFYGAKHCNDEKIRAFWDWQVNCLGFLKGPCEAKVHSRSGSSYNAICT